MICHYWYFKDGFKYQPYVCNRCHDFNMSVHDLNDFFILTVKNVTTGSILLVLIKKQLCIFLAILF